MRVMLYRLHKALDATVFSSSASLALETHVHIDMPGLLTGRLTPSEAEAVLVRGPLEGADYSDFSELRKTLDRLLTQITERSV